MKLITQSELGRIVGVSRQAIRDAKLNGRIMMDGMTGKKVQFDHELTREYIADALDRKAERDEYGIPLGQEAAIHADKRLSKSQNKPKNISKLTKVAVETTKKQPTSSNRQDRMHLGCKTPRLKIARKNIDGFIEEAFPERRLGMCELAFNGGAFSFIDILEYFMDVTGPTNIDICAWVSGEKDILRICEYYDLKKVTRFRMLMHRHIDIHRKKHYTNLINKYGTECLRFTKTHAKFAMIYNERANFVIESSANLNKNTQIELFRVTEDVAFRKFMSSTFDPFFDESFNPDVNLPMSIGFER